MFSFTRSFLSKITPITQEMFYETEFFNNAITKELRKISKTPFETKYNKTDTNDTTLMKMEETELQNYKIFMRNLMNTRDNKSYYVMYLGCHNL